MVETNVFRPAFIAQSLQTANVVDATTETQYAIDRFLAQATGFSNPGFMLVRDRNRLVENGGDISRGYIRRSSVTSGDPTSKYRLYFMYNPEQIQRGYIAYLDQQSLDPGNAMFGSNNMTAAPGILDFSFELLFDRQIEVASDQNSSGTKVDYDYFDLVVRGIVPDSNSDGNAIPDNGIMMVNPHNIVVVFGQDLSVQGRVTNAAVSFEKFNNWMVPMRLRIQLMMKALYIGPVQTIPNYSLFVSESVSTATIPYDESITFTLSSETLKAAKLRPPPATSTSGFSNPGGAGGDTSGRTITIPQAIMYARNAGFSGEGIVHIVSIAIRESGLRTDAVGDVSIETDYWGPSTGLTQIRSVKSQRGTGGERDQDANFDPAIHMVHAFSISAQGSNFGPWSTNIGWEQFRGPVDAALAAGA